MVSGSAKNTQTAPAAAMHEYTRKVPDPPSAAVATGNVWLTCKIDANVNIRSCTCFAVTRTVCHLPLEAMHDHDTGTISLHYHRCICKPV